MIIKKLKLKHFSIIFSIFGILVLYLISTLTQPIAIELKDIQKYEGKEITTKGTVKDSYLTKYGSQIITIEQNGAEIKIFIEDEIDADFGDIIKVTGNVQKYKDEWELIINDKHQIKILEKWKDQQIPLKALAANPLKYDGLNINISGRIDSLFDDYFYLKDDNYEHSLPVYHNNRYNLDNGNKVYVYGKYIYDEENFRYKIIFTQENHGVFPLDSEK